MMEFRKSRFVGPMRFSTVLAGLGLLGSLGLPASRRRPTKRPMPTFRRSPAASTRRPISRHAVRKRRCAAACRTSCPTSRARARSRRWKRWRRSRRPGGVVPLWTQLGPNPIPNGQVSGPTIGGERPGERHCRRPDQPGHRLRRRRPGRRLPLDQRRHELDADLRRCRVACDRCPRARAVRPVDPLRRHRRVRALGRQLLRRRPLSHRQRRHDRRSLGPVQSSGRDRRGRHDGFSGRAISEILVHPTDPGDDLRFDDHRYGRKSVRRLDRLHRSAARHARSLSLDQRDLGVAGLHQADRRERRHRFRRTPSGNLSITDIAIDPTDPNRLVAWVLGLAAANNGGLYLSTDALAPAPLFTQTLITTTASVRGEIAGNRVGATVTFYLANGENPAPAGLRRSIDGGLTWTTFLAGAAGFCGGQCFYDIAVDVHPDGRQYPQSSAVRPAPRRRALDRRRCDLHHQRHVGSRRPRRYAM